MTSIDKKYSMPSILYYTSITWYIVDCIYVRDIRQAFYAINHLSDLFTNVTWKAILRFVQMEIMCIVINRLGKFLSF
jgi:hypothetical protein